MNQEERLDYLVKKLCDDSVQYRGLKVDKSERKAVLRSLMNIRLPKPMSKEFLEIQDSYLKEESVIKGIVQLKDIKTVDDEFGFNIKFSDKVSIWQGDITKLSIDAIVNAANSQMLGCFVPCHKCIDNAIHSAAGIELRQECNKYMNEKRKTDSDYEEPIGKAVITSAYNLPCRYVIHTVGPIVVDKLTELLKSNLKSCYESCLNIAVDNDIRSIAFCCISTGEFHFPNDEAARIAVDTVNEFLEVNEDKIDRVIFNVFKDYDLELYKEVFAEMSV